MSNDNVDVSFDKYDKERSIVTGFTFVVQAGKTDLTLIENFAR